MKKKKIVFLGSKPIGYQCLAYLLEHQEALGVELVGIMTRLRTEFRGATDLSHLAAQYQVPIFKSLDELPECDFIYSVQYHEILKPHHIAKAKTLAVNLHMAPLPEYRGCNQFSFAILDQKEEFGTTIHQLDAQIDHGPILFQRRFAIPKNCWAFQLYDLTVAASYKLFCSTLAHLLSGNYKPLAQEQLIASKGTSLHYAHEIVDIKRIDLSWDAAKIERHIRATTMPGFEPPYCAIDNRKIYFSSSWNHGH